MSELAETGASESELSDLTSDGELIDNREFLV